MCKECKSCKSLERFKRPQIVFSLLGLSRCHYDIILCHTKVAITEKAFAQTSGIECLSCTVLSIVIVHPQLFPFSSSLLRCHIIYYVILKWLLFAASATYKTLLCPVWVQHNFPFHITFVWCTVLLDSKASTITIPPWLKQCYLNYVMEQSVLFIDNLIIIVRLYSTNYLS